MKRKEKKEASKIIRTRLEEGKPRKEILEELSKTYNDRSSVSVLIASTVDNKTKEKYKLLNYILLCFLIVSFVRQIPDMILLFSKDPVKAIVAGFVVLLIYSYCVFQVSKFRGYIYTELCAWVVLGVFSSLLKITSLNGIFEFGIWDIINISSVLAFIGLALYLSKKMFPNYGLWKLKKDNNGDYLLE
jgi:hypothetical protein